MKLPTEHVNLDGHLSVGDMYLFAFSKTCIFPAIVVTVNKTYKNGLRPFLTLPIKEVETVAVQLLTLAASWFTVSPTRILKTLTLLN